MQGKLLQLSCKAEIKYLHSSNPIAVALIGNRHCQQLFGETGTQLA